MFGDTKACGGGVLRFTSVRWVSADEFGVRVSPNPAQSSFQLAYTPTTPKAVRAELVNVFAQTVATADFGKQSAGAQSAQINLDENLPRGVYLYRLMLGSTAVSGKIIRE